MKKLPENLAELSGEDLLEHYNEHVILTWMVEGHRRLIDEREDLKKELLKRMRKKK